MFLDRGILVNSKDVNIAIGIPLKGICQRIQWYQGPEPNLKEQVQEPEFKK